jgi:hypothetical protein
MVPDVPLIEPLPVDEPLMLPLGLVVLLVPGRLRSVAAPALDDEGAADPLMLDELDGAEELEPLTLDEPEADGATVTLEPAGADEPPTVVEPAGLAVRSRSSEPQPASATMAAAARSPVLSCFIPVFLQVLPPNDARLRSTNSASADLLTGQLGGHETVPLLAFRLGGAEERRAARGRPFISEHVGLAAASRRVFTRGPLRRQRSWSRQRKAAVER